MIAPNALKIFSYSEEEFRQYGQFKDMDGDLIGVKDDAPDDFKEAYEEYVKHCEEKKLLGID